jgi:6-phosphofructokinase 1
MVNFPPCKATLDSTFISKQPNTVNPKNIFYAQSGGVTAVINSSACGVIEAAREHPGVFGKVLAGRNGIVGALNEDLIDTSQESAEDIAALRYTPSGAFGSCRYKLKDLKTSAAEYDRLLEVFAAHDIGYFFYNGGNDSADTCLKVAELASARGYPLQAIHIPKTIDNDLPLTDTCPGFGSVAKYVATSVREICYDLMAMNATSTRVFVLEVMGRHAGWIAAAGALASTKEQMLPLVLLLPEVQFDPLRFLPAVWSRVNIFGYCAVIASEGVTDLNGRFLADAGTRDAFGHKQLGGAASVLADMVKASLGPKVHWAVADYLQRCARHIASRTDLKQAYAVGRGAIEFALQGHKSIMVSIKRVSASPYQWEIGHVPLDQVANVEKKMPREFISRDEFGITDACREYLQPLIQGEDFPPFSDGLPAYVRLKNNAVAKKLAETFSV